VDAHNRILLAMIRTKARSLITALGAGTLILVASPDWSRAQVVQASRRELVGIIRDSAGGPIEDATIEIPGGSARSDGRGAFRLWTIDIDTLTISIRRLGFFPISALITARQRQWDTVVVQLDRNPQVLGSVKVKEAATRSALGLRDFETRRAQGIGLFVTREEIVARNTSLPSDIFRNLRGVRLVKLRNGQYGVRFALYSGNRPNCTPDLWLDGQRARGMEVDEMPATDIQAIEVYESWSTVPAPFAPTSNTIPCGTIVIWTRIPG
jgi:hypothetical protein